MVGYRCDGKWLEGRNWTRCGGSWCALGPTGRPESMVRSLFWMRELHPAVPRGFRKGTPAVLGLQVSLERFWRAGRSIYGGFRGIECVLK